LERAGINTPPGVGWRLMFEAMENPKRPGKMLARKVKPASDAPMTGNFFKDIQQARGINESDDCGGNQ
jgi:hypothetical protein